MATNQTGLEHRYRVEKVHDPERKHADCRYFVLDPRHDPVARFAMRAYATYVQPTDPTLARDLFEWLAQLE